MKNPLWIVFEKLKTTEKAIEKFKVSSNKKVDILLPDTERNNLVFSRCTDFKQQVRYQSVQSKIKRKQTNFYRFSIEKRIVINL